MKYQIKLSWDGKSGGELNFKNYPKMRLDTPIEFGGTGRYPCPDDLFFSSVAGCLLTTFLYFKRKLKLHLEGLQILINGNVDFIGPKGYRITRVKAVMHIKTRKNEEEKVKKCVELTKDFCHITRSIEKTIPIEISMKLTYTR